MISRDVKIHVLFTLCFVVVLKLFFVLFYCPLLSTFNKCFDI